MIKGTRTKRVWWRLLSGMLALGAAGSGAGARAGDDGARALFPLTDRILEGRILHVERRDHPERDAEPISHLVAVSIDRTVSGQKLGGEVLLNVWVVMPVPGTMARGTKIYDCGPVPPENRDPKLCGKSFPILILDPAYWREGARIVIADWNSCGTAPPSEGAHPSCPSAPRTADEGLARWADAPRISIDVNHLVRLDDGGSAAPEDDPAAKADAASPEPGPH